GHKLDSFQEVEQTYTHSLFEGRVGRRLDTLFRAVASVGGGGSSLVRLLHETAESSDGVSLESLRRFFDGDEVIEAIVENGLAHIDANRIEIPEQNHALRDYLDIRYRLDNACENRTLVFAECLSKFISRAPKLMAAHYRRGSASGLKEFLGTLCLQTIPAALIDYGRFKDEYKGLSDREIGGGFTESIDLITLPRVFFVDDVHAFYRPFEKIIEEGRSAVAFGFQNETASEESEIVWLAAGIDSKLEAEKKVAEFWCDQLEMIAINCEFKNYRIWLIAPEGFDSEALDLLRGRNAFGSSRRQFDLLRQFLGSPQVNKVDDWRQYEIVIPMDENSELIAAHSVEEIARRHNFDAKSVNQIKTALIEACINAAEHGVSPDKRIHQRFRVANDRIEITVSNRGLRLADKKAVTNEPDEGRRGWGLKLMRRLMDEVKIESVDDGTRISMTKYLRQTAGART
ncbi:MAG: ATP-binding protein, partial [Acidobacteria bacterium]|nr:ATP-binding protein [Acidobacteriota bacterium]MCA1608996.1 ATP-binding protein [Acidobacteriota bacterium]